MCEAKPNEKNYVEDTQCGNHRKNRIYLFEDLPTTDCGRAGERMLDFRFCTSGARDAMWRNLSIVNEEWNRGPNQGHDIDYVS